MSRTLRGLSCIAATVLLGGPVGAGADDATLVRSFRAADGDGVFVSSDDGRLVAVNAGSAVKIWNGQTGEELATLAHDRGASARVSGDGGRLVSSDFNMMKVWDPATFKLVRSWPAKRSWASAVALGSGNLLATGGQDAKVRMWNSARGTQVRVLSGPKKAVLAVAISGDGRSVAATIASDTSLFIWNARTGVARAKVDMGTVSRFALYTPAGQLVVADGVDAAALRDGMTGRKLRGFARGGDKDMRAAALSVDGSTLVTGDAGGTVRLWNVRDGSALASFETAEDSVVTVALLDDGRTVVTGHTGGLVKVWQLARPVAGPPGR
jgi:WD40 repeat protein